MRCAYMLSKILTSRRRPYFWEYDLVQLIGILCAIGTVPIANQYVTFPSSFFRVRRKLKFHLVIDDPILM